MSSRFKRFYCILPYVFDDIIPISALFLLYWLLFGTVSKIYTLKKVLSLSWFISKNKLRAMRYFNITMNKVLFTRFIKHIFKRSTILLWMNIFLFGLLGLICLFQKHISIFIALYFGRVFLSIIIEVTTFCLLFNKLW